MKRILAILLALSLIFCFTACDMSAFEEGFNQAIEDVAKESNKEITRGTIDGDVYKSEFSGITFTKPSDWRYYTDEELAEALNIGLDVFDTSNFSKKITELASVYDMMVIDDSTGTNINFCYENVKLTNGGSITEEEYIEKMKENVNKQSAFTIDFGEPSTVTLCGNTYQRVICNTDYQGIEMTQVYYVRSMGDFINSIVVTIVSGYDVEDIEAMFS